MDTGFSIEQLPPFPTMDDVASLVDLLQVCVHNGASIGFLAPLSNAEARAHFAEVLDNMRSGQRLLWIARDAAGIAGSVQLRLESRPNSRHRAEVQKLLVHPRARGRGLGANLMRGIEDAAVPLGRTLLVLDTRSGDVAERLYRRLGYHAMGVIPAYASSPDGRLEAATFFFKDLKEHAGDVHGFVEHRQGDLLVSTDRSRLDVDAIHQFLSEESYWAGGIPRDTVVRSLEHSLCFGLYDRDRQIGLARVITDRATYAYLCDVYVEAAYRARKIGGWLMECVLAHPELQGLRRFALSTRDAQSFYRRFGFEPVAVPERHMQIKRVNPYGGAVDG